VVVSEETGTISVVVGGMMKRHLAPEMLKRLLRAELCPEKEKTEENAIVKLYQKFQKKDKGGKDNEN
jgi:diadenylate cyclase